MTSPLILCCVIFALDIRILAFSNPRGRLKSSVIHEVRQSESSYCTSDSYIGALNGPSTSIIITGANGVLGQSFLWALNEDLPSAKLLPTYRDGGRLDTATEEFNLNSFSNIVPLIMDMNDIKSNLQPLSDVIFLNKSVRKLVLINNAGVCLEGNTRNILQESLDVNCLSPIYLSELLIKEFSSPSHLMNGDQLTIINISSGDGELVYLHTDIERKISAIKTFQELTAFITNIQINFEENFEYSYGPTPLYSLSKALLNSYTKIKGNKYEKLPQNISLYAVCPGNFISSMSTLDELEDSISSLTAVKNIINMIYSPHLYENGKFYRNSIEIPW